MVAQTVLDVEVEWSFIEDEEEDPLWNSSRVLYALCQPERQQALYIGKADHSTLRRRLRCNFKQSIYEHLVERIKIDRVDVRVGEICTEARLTAELLADVESLLIHRLKPCCNVQYIQSRIGRPCLRVSCTGDWPERRACFVDR